MRVSNLSEFGWIVVDECHRIGAQSFSEICWKPSQVFYLQRRKDMMMDLKGWLNYVAKFP